MKQPVEKVYFFVSFGFVILRTILVSIYGAWIYDESKEPSAYLNSVSSDVYNIEVFVTFISAKRVVMIQNCFRSKDLSNKSSLTRLRLLVGIFLLLPEESC